MPLPPFPVPHPVVRAALGARRRLQDLLELTLPADAGLWDYVAGLQRTRLSGVLVTSGLADALGDGWRQPADLARELVLDRDTTARVLGAAAAARLAVWDADRGVRLSRLGAPLRRDHPHSIASWVAYVASATNGRAYEQLETQLRGGAEPSGHRLAFGGSVWEHFDEHPDEGARFAAAMREMTAIDIGALARAYPWPRRGVVCDVAGGVGTLLAAILNRRRGLRGILVDVPGVAVEAEPFLRSQGVSDRVEIRTGDMFGAVDAHADVYVMKWILHDWSDATCRQILGNVRATMPPGARIVCIDQRLDRDRPSPISSLVDLHMLVVCEGGRERSPHDVHELMYSVGLRPGRVRHSGLHMLVEGVADG